MTIKEHVAAHGPHATARKLVNNRLVSYCGMGIDDLADNCEMADLVDTVSDALEADDMDGVKSALSEIDMDFIESNVFG